MRSGPMKRIILTTIAVFAIIFLLAACGGSNKETNKLETIMKKGTIVAGTSADYPPFEYVDSAGKMGGFDVDMMEEIARQMGVKLEWVDMPFDSLIAAVQEGKIDVAVAAFNFNEERDKVVDFTDPYYYAEDGFLVKEDFAGSITAPEDIAAYKVGVQTGSTADGWVTDNLLKTGKLPEANLFRYERIDQAALDVKSGRIDVLMSDYIPMLAQAQGIGGLKVIYHAEVSTGPVNIVLPQGETELAEKLNEIIKKMIDDGFINKIATENIK
jgi:polar amino acid transport system substrate-binding protein